MATKQPDTNNLSKSLTSPEIITQPRKRIRLEPSMNNPNPITGVNRLNTSSTVPHNQETSTDIPEEPNPSQITTAETGISDHNVALFRATRKLYLKKLRTDSHLKYITRCKNQDTIPKTLCVRLTPQIPDTNPIFLVQWLKHYIQTHGTSMGTKCAPNYAIIFMDQLEQGFLKTQHLQPLMWWRYIDDIFFIWSHSSEELSSFMNELNLHHATIKFTHEVSQHEISFLDTTVKLAPDGTLSTTLYSKPTDAHLYLHHSSNHPIHQIRSIPKSNFKEYVK